MITISIITITLAVTAALSAMVYLRAVRRAEAAYLAMYELDDAQGSERTQGQFWRHHA